MAKYGDASITDRIMSPEMWQGMSAEMLTDSWGSPVDRDREIYKTRTTETWKYGQNGKNGLSIGQSLRIASSLALSKDSSSFRSLTDEWADTITAHGRLVVTILGGLAEFERELIQARTGEGLKRARERGVPSGPKPKLTPHQRREALARREAGESCAEIGRSYNVSHSTILRLKAAP